MVRHERDRILVEIMGILSEKRRIKFFCLTKQEANLAYKNNDFISLHQEVSSCLIAIQPIFFVHGTLEFSGNV